MVLDRSKRRHRQRHDDVDLVGLLILADAPAARGLDCDGATDCQPQFWVGIGDQVAPLDQFVQVLRSRGQVGRRRLTRYMRRWLVERFFAWMQWQRRILVRWEYHTQNFLGFVQLACLVILFRRF